MTPTAARAAEYVDLKGGINYDVGAIDRSHKAGDVRSGKVIGRGHNSDRSRQTTVRRGNMHANAPALHSEVAALANAHRCIL